MAQLLLVTITQGTLYGKTGLWTLSWRGSSELRKWIVRARRRRILVDQKGSHADCRT